MYTLGEAAKETGFSKPTLSRAIKSGKLSATRLDDKSYAINPSELERWVSSNSHRNSKKKRITTPLETPVTPSNDKALQTEVDGLRSQVDLLKSERDDLRVRLDKESDERRQITVRLLEYEKPKGFWARLFGKS